MHYMNGNNNILRDNLYVCNAVSNCLLNIRKETNFYHILESNYKNKKNIDSKYESI